MRSRLSSERKKIRKKRWEVTSLEIGGAYAQIRSFDCRAFRCVFLFAPLPEIWTDKRHGPGSSFGTGGSEVARTIGAQRQGRQAIALDALD
jgi:hypothetical protein